MQVGDASQLDSALETFKNAKLPVPPGPLTVVEFQVSGLMSAALSNHPGPDLNGPFVNTKHLRLIGKNSN